jgi:hypothetical protein
MTSPVEIGWRPLQISPIFSFGQDWIVTFTPEEGTTSPVYPTGTTITARVYADNKLPTIEGTPLKTWTASIVGDDVRFHVEAVETNAVAKGMYMRITIVYPGTPEADPYVWATGKVVRVD